MTIYIAHRGNINGQNPDFENKIDYINNAFNCNYGVEFDVLFYKKNLYLGHDEPQEKLDLNLVHKPNAFIHAKDLNALELLLKLNCNVFWHEEDKITITNKGFGYITSDDYGDIYFHVSDFCKDTLDNRFVNMNVKFNLIITSKGYRGINVNLKF